MDLDTNVAERRFKALLGRDVELRVSFNEREQSENLTLIYSGDVAPAFEKKVTRILEHCKWEPYFQTDEPLGCQIRTYLVFHRRA